IPDAGGSDVTVYDAASQKQVKTISVGGSPGGVVVAPDGRRAFVACAASNEMQVIDTSTWAVTAKVPVGQGPDGIAYWGKDVAMRTMTAAVVVVALAWWGIRAQSAAGQRQGQAPAPAQSGVVSAADFAAIVARQPKDRNGNQTFLQLAPYNVNMEH